MYFGNAVLIERENDHSIVKKYLTHTHLLKLSKNVYYPKFKFPQKPNFEPQKFKFLKSPRTF